MKRTIQVAFEGGQWKVTNANGEWATAPSEEMAIVIARKCSEDFPASERPKIVVTNKEGKIKEYR